MKLTTNRNQLETMEHLYNKLYLTLGDELIKSKKHKVYYLFSVLFSEGWWAEDNVAIVRKAVRDHSLNLIWERRNPDDRDDDNIHIYFFENEKGKFSIILMLDPHSEGESSEILDIIPVKRNDYEMTRIYPRPVRRTLKTARNKNLASQKS